ncbi:MAG: LacI family DNA-binding transcriptional regulator [Cypionkella sp.]
MRVTIKSIAKDLDVSHMTVSRALSGNPNVSAETRQLIQAHALALGYVKSSAANAMRGSPTNIVGLLLPNIVNEFYARFANVLALLCADRGLDLVIRLTNDDAARERQSLLRLQALQAETVIMVPAPDPPGQTKTLPHSTRIIDLIRIGSDPEAGRLLIDDAVSIATAVDHLVATGRPRVGFIGADASLSSGRARAEAFLHAMRRHGMKPDPGHFHTGAPGFAMARQAMEKLLDSAARPQAVICGGFEISNGALEACLHRRVCFPDDLAFVGYGDPPAYQWLGGGITTISLSADDLARRAIALIKGDTASGNVASPTRLILRHSA